MKYDELENLTYNELKVFRYCEMEIPPKEILEKLRSDQRPVPMRTVEMLQSLCDELNQKGAGIKLPKEPLTAAAAFAGLSFMVTFIDKLPDIAQKYAPIVQKILETVISSVQEHL